VESREGPQFQGDTGIQPSGSNPVPSAALQSGSATPRRNPPGDRAGAALTAGASRSRPECPSGRGSLMAAARRLGPARRSGTVSMREAVTGSRGGRSCRRQGAWVVFVVCGQGRAGAAVWSRTRAFMFAPGAILRPGPRSQSPPRQVSVIRPPRRRQTAEGSGSQTRPSGAIRRACASRIGLTAACGRERASRCRHGRPSHPRSPIRGLSDAWGEDRARSRATPSCRGSSSGRARA
jgi:hypothetical protein